MPALITHHLFGEEAARLLPEDILTSEEEMLAFLLGNSGPDPLFFRFRSLLEVSTACHRLGSRMHSEKVPQTLECLHDAVSHLREGDKKIGRAYVLGFLGHYLLDSTAHPFVYAQEDDICGAGVGLEDSHDEVHALIESDLDSWMLWSMRQRTTEECRPHSMLTRTRRITLVSGALMSQAALQVFQVKLSPNEFANCVDDYELLYRLIEPAGSPKADALARVENLIRNYSMLGALAHRPTASDECPAANLDHNPWADPATGQISHESFADLFQDALDRWPAIAEAYARGHYLKLERLLGDRDFNGVPLE